MRKKQLSLLALVAVVVALLATLPLRATNEIINYEDIAKIKAEGLQRSQAMELASWLSDVYAPRLTGSPMITKAADWVIGKMKEWGLANAKIEAWPNRNGFDRGWTNDKFYMAAVSPEPFPIPGTPTAWTPGTNGLVRGEAVLVTATTAEELAAFKGKLKGKWILTHGRPRMFPPTGTAISKRFTADELALMELQPPPGLEFGVTPPGQRAGTPAPRPRRPSPTERARRSGRGPAAASSRTASRAAGPARRHPARCRNRRSSPPASAADSAPANARNEFFRAEGALGTSDHGPARPRHLHHRRQPRRRSRRPPSRRS